MLSRCVQRVPYWDHLGLVALSERTNLAEIARVAALECTFLPLRHIQRAWPVCQENMLQTSAWPNARPALRVGIKMQCKAIYVKHVPTESTVTIRLLVSKSHLVLTRSDCFSDDHGCANTELCPEGSFCNGTTPKPLPCPPGQTTEFRGMASCSKCSVGKKGTGNGCQSCPGNSIANSPGRTTCEECKQGRYATSEKTFCARVVERGNAPIVQLVSANGNRLVVVWNAEDFSTGNATLTVTDKETEKDKYSWPIGLISPILLAPLPLASRVYQVHIQVRYANASSPVSSPVYKGAKWKITSDCTDLQYLQNEDKDMTKWNCTECPPGASCAGSITQDGIKARFGWWRESKSSKVFFQCLKPSACLGAPNPSLETQFLDARKDNNESCQLKTYKASRLCAACRAGYARGNGDGSCNRCKNGFLECC